jgi:hypothetical protein
MIPSPIAQRLTVMAYVHRIVPHGIRVDNISDVAIVQFRKLMINAARTFSDGGQAIGTGEPRIPHVKIRSYEGIVAKATDWRTLGLCEEELALLGKAEESGAVTSMSSVAETKIARVNDDSAPERISPERISTD